MSDTPRTDACRDKLARRGWNPHKDEPVVHLVCEMEQLERELASVRHERDEWKAKYVQQNKDLGCEMMDPNGTIWEHAAKVQQQRDRLERELAEARQQETIHYDNYASMREHRDRLAALTERNRQDSLSSDIAWNKLRDERNDAIEQRDRLAEALEMVLNEIGEAYLACEVEARETLAAVKGVTP